MRQFKGSYTCNKICLTIDAIESRLMHLSVHEGAVVPRWICGIDLELGNLHWLSSLTLCVVICSPIAYWTHNPEIAPCVVTIFQNLPVQETRPGLGQISKAMCQARCFKALQLNSLEAMAAYSSITSSVMLHSNLHKWGATQG